MHTRTSSHETFDYDSVNCQSFSSSSDTFFFFDIFIFETGAQLKFKARLGFDCDLGILTICGVGSREGKGEMQVSYDWDLLILSVFWRIEKEEKGERCITFYSDQGLLGFWFSE